MEQFSGFIDRVKAVRWWWRVPLKIFALAVTVFLVCFPYPNVFIRHVQHWRNPNAMIDPDFPALGPWVDEVQQQLRSDQTPAEALKTIEKFVYKKVPYEWDWNTWGTSDYLPTLAEVLQKGKEDCDGRAVVAASLLRRLGYHADIVADFTHVWVKTDQGETMSPGPRAVVVADEKGITVQPSFLAPIAKALGYGVAVFPFHRELIVLFVLWLLTLQSSRVSWVQGFSPWLLVVGLVLLRDGGLNHVNPRVGLQIAGLVALVIAVAMQYLPRARGSESTVMNSSDSSV